MATPIQRFPRLPAEVTSNPDILGGEPCVRGTRVPAVTILAELRAGADAESIFSDYPSLPLDGIEAVRAWAERQGLTDAVAAE